jgi:predicted lipoprotein with Yx(FWY)xxD motif
MTRRRTLSTLTGAAAAGIVALAVAGCGGGGGGGTGNAAIGPPRTASGKTATVGLASTGLGKVLVNDQGRTLYLFRADHGTTSACTGACATQWPPLRATGKPKVGTGLQASAVATTKRSDGKPQVSYHGHPLYTFVGDKKAGDTTGQGINAFGAAWFGVTASGAQASGSASGSSGGSNGY